MAEEIQFWLDNKLSAGVKVAEIEEQLLVEYREKYYVVVDGVAQKKGSKPLNYSKLSIPTVWRISMSKTPSAQSAPLEIDAVEVLPEGGGEGRAFAEKGQNSAMSENGVQVTDQSVVPAKMPGRSALPAKPKTVKPAGKDEPLQIHQEFVEVKCPYCGYKNEIVLDRGRRAKPFFVPCDKCSEEFAVKLVQVLVYQAQVAGFR